MSGPYALLLETLPAFWWPFCRILAALSIAPFLGDALLPMRMRVAAAFALAIALLPVFIGKLPAIDPFSLSGVAATAEQAVIGLSIGLAFYLVLAVLQVLGYLISSQMALSMAVMNDPGNGQSSDVLSNLLYLFAALLFFAMDAHLVLAQVVVDSFRHWPVGGGLPVGALHSLALSGGWVLSAAILLALPAVFATFVVQVGFGLINRVAPALNLFSLGFPLVTLFGLVSLGLTIRFIPDNYVRLSSQVLDLLGRLMGGAHG